MSVHAQRGSVTPLVALLVVAVGALGLGLGRMGARAVEVARVRAAADATALAGAAEGAEAARNVARANGATVEIYQDVGSTVTVRVRRGSVSAWASASRTLPGPDGQPVARGP